MDGTVPVNSLLKVFLNSRYKVFFIKILGKFVLLPLPEVSLQAAFAQYLPVLCRQSAHGPRGGSAASWQFQFRPTDGMCERQYQN
jgi:hypothetical protein